MIKKTLILLMLFAIGSRVKFIHTGATGVIVSQLEDQMVAVLLDDGDEIPAFIEDLERVDHSNLHIKSKVVPSKLVPMVQQAERQAPAMQPGILESMGIQLAFDPQLRADGSTESFQIHLINDTNFDVLFSIELWLKQRVIFRQNGKLPGISTLSLGSLEFDQLNEQPRFEIECWQLTTAGSGPRFTKTLRLKARQFFSSVIIVPILNKPMHHYKLFEKFDKLKEKEEDLSTYTRRNTRAVASSSGHYHLHDQYSVSEFANFIPEIDLHIEKLVESAGGMNNTAIIRTQLAHFDAFINKAIQLGVDRVYVIHGLGKGKLRDEIASRLINMREVVTFKNEYHPRYGYGATEVLFKEEE